MKNYISFDKNGRILSSGFCQEKDFFLQGENVIEGIANPITQYIQNNKIVDIPEKPNEFCFFDYEQKKWILDSYLQKENIKFKRNKLLFSSDWTQLSNNPLTQEKQQEWAVYRQQLRDITTQSGYPFNVIWPTQPE